MEFYFAITSNKITYLNIDFGFNHRVKSSSNWKVASVGISSPLAE